MGMSIAVLQQHIRDRREREVHIERLELGKGFSVEAVKGVLFIAHDSQPGERAICGFVEDTPQGPRWILYREWAIELRETTGELPSNLAIEGDME